MSVFKGIFPSIHWRNTLARLLIVGLMVTSIGCQNPTPHDTPLPSQRVFRMSIGTEPPNLDPARVTDLTSYTVLQNILRGLTILGPQGEVQPAIARHWQWSADGKRLTLTLRPDARWTIAGKDAGPVTAHDFVFAWRRALQPETAASYAFFLFPIQNAQAIFEGKAPAHTLGANARDATHLDITLTQPTPFFLQVLAAPIALPLPQRWLAQAEKQSPPPFTEARSLIANGPYQLTQWQHDEHIRLVPNPHYWQPPSGVDAIEMLMIPDPNTALTLFEQGALDVLESGTSLSTADTRRQLREAEQGKSSAPLTRQLIHRINYLGFDTQGHPTRDVRVRQALAMAIDRTVFPKLLQSGQRPLASWITPGLFGHNPKLGLSFNPSRARALLTEAGYPNGQGFPTLRLGYVSHPDVQKEMEMVQALWQEHLNIRVALEPVEWKVFLARPAKGSFPVYRQGWFVDYPDADSFMTVFISGSGNNSTNWTSPQFDRWVNTAAHLPNGPQRQALYDRAQRLLLEDDTVMVPLYATEKVMLLKPYVRGFQVNALNMITLDKLTLSYPKKTQP